ncbi:MAG: hypothetical protein LBT92_03470, partial [Rickettsiales bacterium]|nr:hypothetical protein [Rickettsiales bacterium]
MRILAILVAAIFASFTANAAPQTQRRVTSNVAGKASTAPKEKNLGAGTRRGRTTPKSDTTNRATSARATSTTPDDTTTETIDSSDRIAALSLANAELTAQIASLSAAVEDDGGLQTKYDELARKMTASRSACRVIDDELIRSMATSLGISLGASIVGTAGSAVAIAGNVMQKNIKENFTPGELQEFIDSGVPAGAEIKITGCDGQELTIKGTKDGSELPPPPEGKQYAVKDGKIVCEDKPVENQTSTADEAQTDEITVDNTNYATYLQNGKIVVPENTKLKTKINGVETNFESSDAATINEAGDGNKYEWDPQAGGFNTVPAGGDEVSGEETERAAYSKAEVEKIIGTNGVLLEEKTAEEGKCFKMANSDCVVTLPASGPNEK